LTVLRPVKVNGTVSLDGIPSDQVPLLDTAHPHQEGGTGTAFDWPVASGLDRKVVVAGGLGPGTVGDAIRALRPWGVDASSRLESAPGVKDADLIERYVAEAKGA
jgi:phosphoribosylanthranilate isomerase